MRKWNVEIRGTITRDIRRVEVFADSMHEAMTKSVETHPTYRAHTAIEVGTDENSARLSLARMVAVVHGMELFTEGQIANIIGAYDRIDVRDLIHDGRAHIQEHRLQGENGRHLMTRLGLE